MRALVTGGAGFIGSHLVDRLVGEGFDVVVLDDFSTGKRENLAASPSARVVEGNVADFATVRAAIEGVDLVFHQAAVASVPKTIEDPLGSHQANYVGTLNVLEASRLVGAKRVVLASTAAVYGDLPELPKKEDMKLKPLSPYAVDKLASELACQMYFHLHGLETVCLRYFNIFGPRQDPASPYSGVISIFVNRLKQGTAPTIFGDGQQTRDFVYVADVVEANMRAASTAGVGGQVFNVGGNRRTSLLDLYETLSQVLGVTLKPGFASPRMGDIKDSRADAGKAEKLLGWKAQVSFEEGIKRLVASVVGG